MVAGASRGLWEVFLGFVIGPEHASRSWDKPLRKYIDRIRAGSWSKFGLHGASVIYNIIVLPVLSFVAQLERPPQHVLDAEVWGLRRVAPGPYRWALPTDLWYLRDLGLSFRFRSLSRVAIAAQARVGHQEAVRIGGLELPRRRQTLADEMESSVHIVRVARWRSWFNASHAGVLIAATAELVRRGAGPRHAEEALSAGSPRPWTRQLASRVKGHLQRWMCSRLETPPPGHTEERMRHKLARWRLSGFPRLVAWRILGRLRGLRALVAPRVQVAVLSSLFNRWVTGRRFQRQCGGRCALGCEGDDSLEHYLRCRVGRAFAARCLDLHLTSAECWECMMLAQPPAGHGDTPLTWQRVAILHYALYRVVHARLHCALPDEQVNRALRQAVTEAVRGHPASAQLLNTLRT